MPGDGSSGLFSCPAARGSFALSRVGRLRVHPTRRPRLDGAGRVADRNRAPRRRPADRVWGMSVAEIRDGLVRSWREHWNPADAALQNDVARGRAPSWRGEKAGSRRGTDDVADQARSYSFSAARRGAL